MKFAIVLILIFSCALESFTQVFVNGVNINQESAEYCSVRLGSGLFMSGYHAFVDYGQNVQTSRNRIVTHKSGEKMNLNSKMHLLNFMASNGWKFIEVLEDTDEDGTSFNYVFRKEGAIFSTVSMKEWDCIPQL